jgi:TolA-binding protein
VKGEHPRADRSEHLAQTIGDFISTRVRDGNRSSLSAAGSYAEVEARVGRGRSRARARRLILAAAGCALVAGGGAFWARARFVGRLEEPITYSVNGGPPRSAASVPLTTWAAKDAELAFSDGTHVQMAADARGRVVELGRHGGRIALDDGKAHVQVMHRPGASWLFEAGPFVIHVHGTAFSVAWTAREALFDLRMESGVVSVSGPLSGGEIVLRAGETLSVRLQDHEVISGAAGTAQTDHSSPRLQSEPQRPALAPLPPQVAPGPGAPRPSAAGRSRRTHKWAAELSEGHAADIIADAQRQGIGSVLADSDSEELAALADAARYQRNHPLARQVLLAQRRRFPRSARAAEASFLLGRLADESPGDLTRAVSWYDRYLEEAPTGAYASEALGRKMMVLERGHRRSAAAAVAADYLHRFPVGTYARAAEAIVGQR